MIDAFRNLTAGMLYSLLGTDREKPLLDFMAFLMILTGVVTYIALQFMPAPYGRFSNSSFGFLVPARFAWVVQELPSVVIPLFVYFIMDNGKPTCASQILVLLFVMHYSQRTFIYPMLIRGGKPTPFGPFFLAFLFTAYNGYMQSRSILKFRGPTAPDVTNPMFVVGVALFVVGMVINIHSDHILRSLRADGAKGYKIPYGGMFNVVSAANYFGEIVEWWGFALATCQVQGVAFAIFTMANLVPRGISHHQWYLEKFRGEYPRDRAAVLPLLI